MDSTSEEKRQHPRIAILRPLVYQSDSYPKTRRAFTRDLSLGGAGIQSVSPLSSQERLNLWFSFQPRVIPCTGRVVHVRQVGNRFHVGISFESMADEDRMALTQYVSDLMKEKGQD